MTKTILLSHFYNYERLLKNIKMLNVFTFFKVKKALNGHFIFHLMRHV